jgi:hypothetical protein
MAYSLLSTGIDDFEDHPEYAAYLNPSSTTFEHNSILRAGNGFALSRPTIKEMFLLFEKWN